VELLLSALTGIAAVVHLLLQRRDRGDDAATTLNLRG
jgi:hypothetical protein